jgi:putative sigma-54 modulation protein
MNLIVRGHKLQVTPSIKAYAEKKLSKLENYFSNIIEAVLELEVSPIKNKDVSHIAKLTLSLPSNIILRGEERTNDIYAAIDLLTDKMVKPLKKQHDRLKNSHKKGNFFSKFKEIFSPTEINEEIEDKKIVIKKEPRAAFKPMDPVEAVLQLAKSNSDFLVFNNTKIHHQVSIVYNRHNGTYGLQTFKDMYMKRAKIKKFKEMPANKKYTGAGIKITKIKDLKVEEISPLEAVEKLNKSKEYTFVTFTNTENDKVCVVYRKKDNTYGLIEPHL